MNIVAFGRNLGEEETKVIKQMAGYLTDKPVEVFDLDSYEPKTTKEDVLLLYGERAFRMCCDLPCRLRAGFPEASRLVAGFGDENERRGAFSTLKILKKQLEVAEKREVYEISEESLPNLEMSQVMKMLDDAMQGRNTEAWVGQTKDGRTIRLTKEYEESDADANITFVELFLIKAAMEALQIKELEIVCKPNVNREGGTQ
jgi:hypothetical protein